MGIKLELPSHIKNALLNLNVFRKEVDLIINVIDARSTKVSNLDIEISKLFPNTKILSLFSKVDLADIKSFKNGFDFRVQSNRNKILKLIKDILASEREKLRAGGYLNPHFQILVVGLPNTGKSTLINLLKNKKISPCANTPGVTKKITKYYLGDNLWLYDSPGIFFYKNISEELLQKLIVINAVPAQIKEYSNILESSFLYLKKHYPKAIEGLNSENYDDFIASLAKRYNFKSKNDIWDISKAEEKFLLLLRNGGIKNISWDQ